MSEKIEIGYRHIGTVAGIEYHHKFLLYTDKIGKQYTISGWTDDANQNPNLPFGNIRILAGTVFDVNNPDSHIRHPEQKQYRELIAEAPDLSAKWAEMVKNAQSKDNIYPYDYLRQNSNTLADTVLREAGFPEPEKDGLAEHLAPGSGNRLDKTLIPKNPNSPSVSDIGNIISLEETPELHNTFEYARTPSFEDIPISARNICAQCKTLLVEFDREEGITRNQADYDAISRAMGIKAYAEGLPEVHFIHIQEDGQINIGYESYQGLYKDTSIQMAEAFTTSIEESVTQARQAERDLALAAEQRELELAEYRAQSRGMSIG